jgi:predicted ribosome quality control (RQC) complex YloA/Tae2 family protein
MNPIPIHLPPHLQHLKGDELNAAIKQEYRVQAIAFIMRQTDYSDEVANERLDELKDPMKVIQEYLGESKIQTTQPVCNSKNKMKYGEIRKFMDAGARQYNRQKEINERRRKYQEYIEQQQQQQQDQQQQQQQQQDQQQPANE